jgi:hypothetical protein
VKVVRHQAVGVQLPLVPGDGEVEQLEKELTIPIVGKERQLAHAARDDVVGRTFELHAGRTRQWAWPFLTRLGVRPQDLAGEDVPARVL